MTTTQLRTLETEWAGSGHIEKLSHAAESERGTGNKTL